jgi:hypothetical protein
MQKAQIVCLIASLASACSSSAGTAAHGSPSPSAISSTPNPSASPSTSPANSPSPTATLTCRLPITASAGAGEPPGGWITFPGGSFARDAASNRNRSGYHLPSYDRAIGAWVPVEYENVAPDGLSYVLYHDATTQVPNALYVVDAKTDTRRLIPSAQAPGSKWELVLDYASEGLYLAAPGYGMAPPLPGLWLLDPTTGGIRIIEGSHVWSKVAGGAAWSIEPLTPGAVSYKAYRLDLRTGHLTTWYETKTAIRPLSPTPDGGLLVVSGEVGSYRLAELTGPNIYVPLEVPADFKLGNARLARPGVWLSLTDGIALHTRADGVRVMANSAGQVLGGFGFYDAAGGCW